jgi:hypothetical protein
VRINLIDSRTVKKQIAVSVGRRYFSVPLRNKLYPMEDLHPAGVRLWREKYLVAGIACNSKTTGKIYCTIFMQTTLQNKCLNQRKMRRNIEESSNRYDLHLRRSDFCPAFKKTL